MGKLIKEFKEFAFKGNVIDMAVGVVIGSAFTGIVTSVVNDLFTPLIAKLTGSVDFSALSIALGSGENAPTIAVGSFIQAVINFFLIAICVFAFVKVVNKMRKPKVEAPKPAPRLCPFCKSAIADDATRCPHCTSQL
ncbi:MAG: large conductance mechanosensitive channel protein MscL [Clostridia bacterium]|nr:large conductance mechanosensitive channel protein MscL [Clostridia bacterium]